jgi:uncharacterized phage protein gp47/JayE
VSFVPRRYDEIIRDLMTTLTGGTARESVKAPAGDTAIVPAKLRDRPVRRISNLQGFVGTPEKQIPYRFTAADFELISTTGDDANKDAIRFRDGGRRPIPNSDLTVNYYPVQTPPVPLNDLNVGSIVRTLLETVSLEMAVMYQQLQVVYDSAFLETAEGRSLDKVVALVGVRRLAGGHPVVKVRFERQSGATGRITVPAGTALTDNSSNRYLTNEELVLEPGESTRDVMAAGETPGVADVDTAALNRPEIVIAGIDKVSNPEPSRRLGQDESDDELRRRAQGAFQGVSRGTLDSLRFHLLSLTDIVKDVTITEEPNGVPGEVRIDVAYFQETPEARALVEERIRQVKPAGIRVTSGSAARRRINVRVALTLAGTGVSGSDFASLRAALEASLVKTLNSTAPGGAVRRARLISIAMQDERIVDAKIFLAPDGGEETEELTLNAGEVLEVITPIQFSQPATEQSITTIVDVKVSALLPIHLTPGTTAAQAQSSIEAAFLSHLTTRATDAALTLDTLAAAIRDDSRFALVRSEAIVTIESGSRFFQLTDGVGSYAPAPNEILRKETLSIDVREGAA